MAAEALMKGRAQQKNVARVTDGSELLERLMRDGAYIAADWLVALAIEGRVFVANYGQGTSAVTAKTALTAAQPDMNLDVPLGTSVIPVAFHFATNAMAGTANHFFVQAGTGNVVGNGTSSAASSLTAVVQGQGPVASACTARQAYSGSGTAPGTGSNANPGTLMEFISFESTVAAAAGVVTTYDWNANFAIPTIITGPGSISGYGVSTSTAMVFKATLIWIELPSIALS